MSNVTVNIVVEGPSERNFLKSLVAPDLGAKGVFISPSVVGKPGHKGGNIKFDRVFTDIENYLKQRTDTVVTTMFDYFRLDSQWPGMSEIQRRLQNGEAVELADKALILQTATLEAVKAKLPTMPELENRFIPYFQMHEFEALLFSDGSILAERLNMDLDDVHDIIDSYETPEHINTDPLKAPSKQIESLAGSYKKVRQSLPVAQAIGLSKMRQKCQLFNLWLTKFEAKAS